MSKYHDIATAPAHNPLENLDKADQEARRIGLTAASLSEVLSPEHYATLYLTSLGYEPEDSASLQRLALGTVSSLRAQVHRKLLAAGNMSSVMATGRAFEIGFFPDPTEQPDEGVPEEGTAADKLDMVRLICRGATNDQVHAMLGGTRTGVETAARELLIELNASNRAHLPRRAYQARLLRPAVDPIELPVDYAEMIRVLEERNHGPLISMPRENTISFRRSNIPSVAEAGNSSLDVEHLKLEKELTPSAEAALAPSVRAAIGLSHPSMEREFTNGEELCKVWSAASGQAEEEMDIYQLKLRAHEWAELYRGAEGNGIRLTAKGSRLIRLGIRVAQAESETPLPKPPPKETSD